MNRPVIVGYSRSPFTLAKKGGLVSVRPEDLLSEVIKNLVIKSKINPEDIEDIIAGCAFPEGEQGFNIGKIVTFMTGMNVNTAGMTVNRWCGSSMQSIHIGAGAIAMGAGKAFICCGVESMTRVPMNGFNPMPHPKLHDDNPNVYLSMGTTAENVAKRYQLTRKAQQDFAISSHVKASSAESNGNFKDEITTINNLDLYKNLVGVAGLLKNLDLFISVSNSTAHLAGALGVKTLLIKPFNHATYHYWNQPSSNTPWYSSIKLINKKTLNQESNIIKKNLDKLD